MKLDSIHFDFSAIDGYNKPFNFAISEREDGKTTAFHVKKARKAFEDYGRPTIVLRRQIADITEAYLDSFPKIINKFSDTPIKLEYKSGSMKDGILGIYSGDKLAYYVVSLSIALRRLKALFVDNPAYFLFDEFICNTRMGEKYLPDEVFKFKELYTTLYRESTSPVKCYFLGNPYSMTNPYFSDFGVDPRALAHGGITSGSNWVVQYHELSEALKQSILARNPLYQFEDAYTRYALKGQAINDANIRLFDSTPQGFSLRYAFYSDGKYLGIYENNNYDDFETQFYCAFVPSVPRNAKVFCFDFNDLMSKIALISPQDKRLFSRFRVAIRTHSVAFSSLEADYFIEEIFSYL